MKPDWDKLGDEYADSQSVLIADVDCTVYQDVCSRYGVRGYPTIKYFTGATAADGDKYEGGRDYKSLSAFAKDNLGPTCSMDNKDLCDEQQLADIAAAEALTDEEIAEKIDEATQAIADAEQAYKDTVSRLQAEYEQAGKDKDQVAADLSPDLKIWRMVSKSRASSMKDEL